jgi:hypothetical protein
MDAKVPLVTSGVRATKFTPERIRQIENLVERGRSREEIAEILGVAVGSLQVTCSKMGISLRRPKIINGVCLAQKHAPYYENANGTHQTCDQNRPVRMQAIEQPSQENLQPAEPLMIASLQTERAIPSPPCSASFAITFQYRGMERTAELPLTPHTSAQLALEAAVRDIKLGELIAALITAVLNKDLFALVLDTIDPATNRVAAQKLG